MDGHERVDGSLERLAVDLEGRAAVEHDVQLLLARARLVWVADQRAVLAWREGIDSECVDPEVLAHRDASPAPLDLFEARDLQLGAVVHPVDRTVSPFRGCGRRPRA